MARLLLLFVLALPAHASTCAFPSPPTVLFSSGAANLPGSKRIQMREIENRPAYWHRKDPEVPSLTRFLNRVRLLVQDVSPAALLKRALIAAKTKSPEAFNVALALVKADTIRPISCIESLLLAEQTDRLDMVKTPTEFTAFFLKSRTSRRLKILTYTENQAGIKGLGDIIRYVEQELTASRDWYLWMHLHNHNFSLDRTEISGVTAPSGTDVGAFRSLAQDMGLHQSRITNGFDTIRIDRADFSLYMPSSSGPRP